MDERWRVLAVLTTARTAMGFQLQTVGSVAPALREALSIDDAGIGFLIGLFLLPGIAFALPSGMIGNRFGDKRIVLFGLRPQVRAQTQATFPLLFNALFQAAIIE